MKYLLLFIIALFTLNCNAIQLKGEFLLGFDEYLLLSYSEDDVGDFPSYDILIVNTNKNEIDTFLTNVFYYDFEKKNDSLFFYTDGYSIWSFNTQTMIKTLLYSNKNQDNYIYDITLIGDEVYFFQTSFGIIENKMLLYHLNGSASKLISTFEFSEYEAPALVSYIIDNNAFFTVGQSLYWFNISNDIIKIEDRVYELYINDNKILYGFYNQQNEYQYIILNVETKEVEKFEFTSSFKKYDWRDSKLRCLNKHVYFFDNGRIFRLNENNQWKEVSSILLFKNNFHELRLSPYGELKLIYVNP